MLLCHFYSVNKMPQKRQRSFHATNGIEHAINVVWLLHLTPILFLPVKRLLITMLQPTKALSPMNLYGRKLWPPSNAWQTGNYCVVSDKKRKSLEDQGFHIQIPTETEVSSRTTKGYKMELAPRVDSSDCTSTIQKTNHRFTAENSICAVIALARTGVRARLTLSARSTFAS